MNMAPFKGIEDEPLLLLSASIPRHERADISQKLKTGLKTGVIITLKARFWH